MDRGCCVLRSQKCESARTLSTIQGSFQMSEDCAVTPDWGPFADFVLEAGGTGQSGKQSLALLEGPWD